MKYFAALILLICFFVNQQNSQTINTESFDKVNITFLLEAEPTIEVVGFDNPKSSWKVKYEIYVTDFAELEKLGKCGFVEGRSIKNCSNLTDKKLDKKIKKIAYRIAKGKFSQNQLAKEENRKFFRPFSLDQNAINIFREAKQFREKNPVLIVYVSSKISTKNSEGAKLKKSYETEGFNWWKIHNTDSTIEYKDIDKMTYHLVVRKLDDGKLIINVGYIHIG